MLRPREEFTHGKKMCEWHAVREVASCWRREWGLWNGISASMGGGDEHYSRNRYDRERNLLLSRRSGVGIEGSSGKKEGARCVLLGKSEEE